MTTRDTYRDNRTQAYETGQMYYESGKCIKCHNTRRYTSSAGCVTCSHRRIDERRKGDKHSQKHGPAIYERNWRPTLLKPWPYLQLAGENIEPGDHIGSYSAKQYIAQRYNSSAADASEG